MRDIAMYKSIHYSTKDRVNLQQYVFDHEESDVYLLDMYAFEVFEFKKFMDGDLLSLQLSGDFLDRLCEAWLAHRQRGEEKQREA